MRHYQAKDFFGAPRGPFASVSVALEPFAADPLVAPPGALLEKAAGERFLELLRSAVTDPLRLPSISPDDGGPVRT